jgi:hypothetical protein
MLAAQFVALAENGGMAPSEINAALKNISENSAIQEFWITDTAGHAYLTNTGLDFTFSPDPANSPFRVLLDGRQKVVIQERKKREIDDQVFKYVGVAGVDKPRIVQVGISEKNFPACKRTERGSDPRFTLEIPTSRAAPHFENGLKSLDRAVSMMFNPILHGEGRNLRLTK